MGTGLYNEEKAEKYYFIKMIHLNPQTESRDIYVLAFNQNQIQKWDNSLGLCKEPVHIDETLELMRDEFMDLVESLNDGNRGTLN
jgi:hypothetical protein